MVIYQKTSTKTYGVGIFITTDMASPFVKYMNFFFVHSHCQSKNHPYRIGLKLYLDVLCKYT